jgi:serine/threonine protein kinase
MGAQTMLSASDRDLALLRMRFTRSIDVPPEVSSAVHASALVASLSSRLALAPERLTSILEVDADGVLGRGSDGIALRATLKHDEELGLPPWGVPVVAKVMLNLDESLSTAGLRQAGKMWREFYATCALPPHDNIASILYSGMYRPSARVLGVFDGSVRDLVTRPRTADEIRSARQAREPDAEGRIARNTTLALAERFDSDLDKFLKSVRALAWPGGRTPWLLLISLIRDCLSGLTHLRRFGRVHHDVKPENVLVARAPPNVAALPLGVRYPGDGSPSALPRAVIADFGHVVCAPRARGEIPPELDVAAAVRAADDAAAADVGREYAARVDAAFEWTFVPHAGVAGNAAHLSPELASSFRAASAPETRRPYKLQGAFEAGVLLHEILRADGQAPRESASRPGPLADEEMRVATSDADAAGDVAALSAACMGLRNPDVERRLSLEAAYCIAEWAWAREVRRTLDAVAGPSLLAPPRHASAAPALIAAKQAVERTLAVRTQERDAAIAARNEAQEIARHLQAALDTAATRESELRAALLTVTHERDAARAELRRPAAPAPALSSPASLALARPPARQPSSHDPASFSHAIVDYVVLSPAAASSGAALVLASNGATVLVRYKRLPPEGTPRLALKIVYNLGVFSASTAARNAASEYEILALLPLHQNIMRMYHAGLQELPDDFLDTLPLSSYVRDLCIRQDPFTGQITRASFMVFSLEYLDQTLQARRDAMPPRHLVPFPLLLRWSCDLMAGVAHMYRHRVLHLDMRLDNIMLAGDERLVIIDFGFAMHFPLPDAEPVRRYEHRDGVPVCSSPQPDPVTAETWAALERPEPFAITWGTLTTNGKQPFGSLARAAPEVQNAVSLASSQRRHDAVIDYTKQAVFDSGVLICEMMAGEHPLGDYPMSVAPHRASPDAARTPSVRPYGPEAIRIPVHHEAYPDAFLALLRRMVAFHPEDRPSVGEVLRALWDEL